MSYSFSFSVDWTAAAVSFVLAVVYVAVAVAAGRRFGARVLWAVWIGGIVAGSLIPILMHGGLGAHFDLSSMIHHAALIAIPLGTSTWVIARTLRWPHPVTILVQIALGVLAFVVTFLVMAMVGIAWIMTH